MLKGNWVYSVCKSEGIKAIKWMWQETVVIRVNSNPYQSKGRRHAHTALSTMKSEGSDWYSETKTETET
jgi:hypothetical protein